MVTGGPLVSNMTIWDIAWDMRAKEEPSFLRSQETNKLVSPGMGTTLDLPLSGVSVQPLAMHCHVWRVNKLSPTTQAKQKQMASLLLLFVPVV